MWFGATTTAAGAVRQQRTARMHRIRVIPVRLAAVSPLAVHVAADTTASTVRKRALHTSPSRLGRDAAQVKGRSRSRESNDESKAYAHTLQLPTTPFQIRANAAKRDHLFYDRTCSELYDWQKTLRSTTSDSRQDFVFHDGPPYANGHLHCGHALNKILKDISNRFQVLRGKRVHFMPGWDCHGLPIEAKALAHLRATERDQLSAVDIRQRARLEAMNAIEIQKSEFAQFGIMADWSDPSTYRTLDPKYEANQLRVFGDMVRKGLIYRQYRPVYWSPSNRTALAESELEYRDDHLSKAVYVAFDLLPSKTLLKRLESAAASHVDNLKAVIWTTTPWSLPSNAAISVNPNLEYSVVQRTSAQDLSFYLVATERVATFAALDSQIGADWSNDVKPLPSAIGPLTEILRIKGADLVDSNYRMPLAGPASEPRPIMLAEYVTALSGTGLVHSAPAHGAEDYEVWKQHGMLAKKGIFSPVDDYGRYTAELTQLDPPAGSSDAMSSISARLVGKDVLTDGAREVVSILREKGALVSMHTLRHKYPYDWRSKQPVIVRATAQWFANLDRVKDEAIAALRNVTFVPSNSRARLEAFIRGRSEWCISRQRVWGVPIPVLYDIATDEPLMTPDNIEHIASILETRGTDYWWEAPAEEFVAPEYRKSGKQWRKGEDTVDVWFDSGTSWATLRESLPDAIRQQRRSSALADVYFEGSDQHRGWFQSSLITAVATTPEGQEPSAPYSTVVTHGYVLDNESRKMSKSLGNVVSPLTIINGGTGRDQPAYGIDVLRLWAARSDYTTDPPIGNLIISKTAETLRKLRNTARFMLANLPAPEEVQALDRSRMTLLDRYVMHELHALEISCAAAYEAYDFAQVVRRMTDFTNGTLSNLYLDIAKDCLYIDARDSVRRTTMVSVIDQILKTFSSILAPITPFLAEEIHHFRHGAKQDPEKSHQGAASVFWQGWQSIEEQWSDATVAADATQLLRLRDTVLVLIEQARQNSEVKSSFEVEVDLALSATVSTPFGDVIGRYENELTQLFNVARVNVLRADTDLAAEQSSKMLQQGSHGEVRVAVRTSSRHHCPRCRTSRRERAEEALCSRCRQVVDSL